MFKVISDIHSIFCGGNEILARKVFNILANRGHNVLLVKYADGKRYELEEVLS